ncbi:retrovirus-related pol polyprotein from transposon TNT 1-94 [Tanacetum coccineum]
MQLFASSEQINGTEFVNKTLDGWFESVGISHETSRHLVIHNRTAVSKRRNRTLMEALVLFHIFAKAPLFLWAEAVATACYTLNRSLVHTLHGKTYYELLKGKKPNLLYFRVLIPDAILPMTTMTKRVHVAIPMNLPKGLTPVTNQYQAFAPQYKYFCVKPVTELELTALQSGRSRSALVKDPEPPSVPYHKEQVEDDLFNGLCMIEVVPIPPVVPKLRLMVPDAPGTRESNVHLPHPFSQRRSSISKASYLINYLYQTLVISMLKTLFDSMMTVNDKYSYIHPAQKDFQNLIDEYGDSREDKLGLVRQGISSGSWSKGRTVADSIAERLTRPTAYKFKTDCSIIPVWIKTLHKFHTLDEGRKM